MAIDDTPVTFSGFDAADYLRDEADITAYLEAAVAENDPVVLARALGAIARARNMSDLARHTGLTRQSLYKSLSGEGNPSLDTIMRVTTALGYRIAFKKCRSPRVSARKKVAKRLPKAKAKATRV